LSIHRCLDYYEDRVRSSIITAAQSKPPKAAKPEEKSWTSWLTLRAKESKESPPALSKEEVARQGFVAQLIEKSKESLSRYPKFGLLKKDRWAYRMSLQLVEKARENVIKLIGGPAVVDKIRENEVEILQKAYSLIQTNINNRKPHVAGDPIADVAALEIGLPSNKTLVPQWWPVSMKAPSYNPLNIQTEANTITSSNTLEKSTHTFDLILGSDSIIDISVQDQATQVYDSLVHKSLHKANSILERYIPRTTEVQETIVTQDNSIAYLSDWELFIDKAEYMVFRKPYADTGLYQFKVIGSYSDVTAKDFYDVQV